MFSRDLAIALRAPVTWFTTGAAALLIGHGYVLAIDIYSAGSRSALSNALMSREFDPLLGIVRPTLGGLNLALSLFGPLLGARVLAVEKERRTFHAALLSSGSVVRFVGSKWAAAFLTALLPCLCVCALLLVWCGLGGHLAWAETILAMGSPLLYAGVTTALGVAAAAFASSFAQAATLALLGVAASWAVDAAEGFSALAWLGGAEAWSPASYLSPLEQGALQLSSVGWCTAAILGLLVLACVGCRFDVHGWRKLAAIGVAAVLLVVGCAGARSIVRAWDLTEGSRRSLPPRAAAELARLPGPLRIVVNLDREDGRRRQLETDTLAKLRLARPDLQVSFPPDERSAPALLEQDDAYGTITIHLHDRSVTTTSTSRRELTTLIFEFAGKPLPDWTQPTYAGYPAVIDGPRRSFVLLASYVLLPLSAVLFGLRMTRARRK